MRLLVCGGRSFFDVPLLNRVLDELHAIEPVSYLINGGQRGADNLAQAWAERNGVDHREFRPDWKKYGPPGGPIRNTRMLKEKPDLVIAFKGGKGTTDMIKQTKAAMVPLREYDESGNLK